MYLREIITGLLDSGIRTCLEQFRSHQVLQGGCDLRGMQELGYKKQEEKYLLLPASSFKLRTQQENT